MYQGYCHDLVLGLMGSSESFIHLFVKWKGFLLIFFLVECQEVSVCFDWWGREVVLCVSMF